jgi:hypothetical protein
VLILRVLVILVVLLAILHHAAVPPAPGRHRALV